MGQGTTAAGAGATASAANAAAQNSAKGGTLKTIGGALGFLMAIDLVTGSRRRADRPRQRRDRGSGRGAVRGQQPRAARAIQRSRLSLTGFEEACRSRRRAAPGRSLPRSTAPASTPPDSLPSGLTGAPPAEALPPPAASVPTPNPGTEKGYDASLSPEDNAREKARRDLDEKKAGIEADTAKAEADARQAQAEEAKAASTSSSSPTGEEAQGDRLDAKTQAYEAARTSSSTRARTSPSSRGSRCSSAASARRWQAAHTKTRP